MWIQKVTGGGVQALAFAPGGRTLYTKDAGGWVSKWDVPNRKGGRAFRPGKGHAFYGGFGLAGHGRYVVAVNDTIVVQDTTTRGAREVNADALTNYQYPSYVVQSDPTAPRLLTLSADGVIASWDLAAWSAGPVLCELGETTTYPYFDLMPDGRALLCYPGSGRVYLFDAAAGAVVAQFAVNIGPVGFFLGQPAPDGKSALLFSGHHIFVWDLAADAVRAGPIASYLPGTITAFHPTAPVFAALDPKRQLTLFSLDTGAALRTLDFDLGAQVQSVCFSPDGLTCAVGGSNKRFAVFDVDL
jgi:WD40 repeat protein